MIVRGYLCSHGLVKLLALFSCGFLIIDSANYYALYNYEFCQKPSIASFLSAISGREIRGEASRPWYVKIIDKVRFVVTSFHQNLVAKVHLATGCSQSGKLHCFPCLLFGNSSREKAWNQSGVNDWKHLSVKVN